MSRALVTCGVAITSGVAGATIARFIPSLNAALTIAISGACLIPVLSRVWRGVFDVFEPIVVANLAFIVMYVARPAAILINGGSPGFKGYDLSTTLREALFVSLVGVCFFQLGYALPGRNSRARSRTVRNERWLVGRTVASAACIAAAGAGLFALFLAKSGGLSVLHSFLSGRDSSQDPLYASSSAYMYGAPALFFPASLLLVACGLARRRTRIVVVGVALMIPLMLFAGAQGSRITILPLVLAPLVFAYLFRGRRPSALTLLVLAYFILTVGIAFFRETRTASAHVDRARELASAVEKPGYELHQLVGQGIDNDMFESLAAELQVVPQRIAASPVNYVYRTLAKPIPSEVWAGKPLAPSEELTKTLYPEEQSRASSSAGLIGDLYLAGELPAVAFGMMLCGFLLRAAWERWRISKSSSGIEQLYLATLVMFVPILLRGSVGDTAARAFFGLVPIALAARWCIERAALPRRATTEFGRRGHERPTLRSPTAGSFGEVTG